MNTENEKDVLKEFPATADFDVIAFDMDNTITRSKMAVDPEMAKSLCQLLHYKKVAVISGAHFPQFEKELLGFLPCAKELDNHLENLFILTTQGGAFYEYADAVWQQVYIERLSEEEKKRISAAFEKAFIEKTADGQSLFTKPTTVFGKLIEDRDSQMTFSALGSEAPIEDKQKWDPDHKKRDRIVAALEPLLPDFTIDIGGTTTIDITKKGIDKAYGLHQLASHLKLPLNRIIYVGDALFPGGNDAPALSLVSEGLRTVSVASPSDTQKLMHSWLEHVA